MPLLDHFRPPLSVRRHWHSSHHAWATFIASDLNARLPEGYFAEPNVQFGIEIDRAGLALGWRPPGPSMTIPFAIVSDLVEVAVFDASAGPILAGAIGLVSPANKDRAAYRDAFTAKCVAYLQDRLGVVVVDVVTPRGGHLHGELLARFHAPDVPPTGDELFSSAYRPVDRDGQVRLDIWRESLALGLPLPVMPLWLKGGPCLPVDLEATYERTRREQRMADRA